MNTKVIIKSCALAVVLMSSCFTSIASEPTIANHINSNGSIVVIQPEAMNVRLLRQAEEVTVVTSDENNDDEQGLATSVTPKIRAGYRIQVFDDNNVRTAKQEAESRKQQIESRFPHLNAYVSFNSPYWRVKVGDFTTRSEAEATMAEIRQQFPAMSQSLRIVRDRIKQQ